MKRIYYTFSLLVLLNTSLFAQYSLPIYEPFDGVLGQLASQKGWTGNVVAPGNGAQVVNYPLTYPGLYAVPASYAILYGNQPSGGTQALGFVSQVTTVYASFLIQVSSLPLTLANSRYNFGYGSTTTGGTFAGCMYVVPTSATTFDLGFNGTNSQPNALNTTIQNFALNTTIMVVMAYTPGAAGTGTVSAWVNPDASSFGGPTAPTPTFSAIAGGSAATVASVFIRSGANTNPMNFDELRVGTSWSDVTSYNVALPVSLADFGLTTRGSISTLNWFSNTEINFSKYVILYSKNGTDFSEIGALKAMGNNSRYSFNFAHDGEAFFKLKLVDLDGYYVFSDVLHSRGNSVAVKIGPNPFSDRLYFSGMPAGVNTIVLYSANGSKVKTQPVNDRNATLSLSTIPSGSYVINIINEGRLIYTGTAIKK